MSSRPNQDIVQAPGAETLDIDAYHRDVLVRAPRLAEAARSIGAGRSFGLRITDHAGSWTYCSDGDTMVIKNGIDDADLAIELKAAAFNSLMAQEFSIIGLFYTRQMTLIKGSFNVLMHWEPALQALFFDRPIWRKDSLDNIEGLDIQRAFTLQELQQQPEQLQTFLHRAGFLHIKGVFSAAEVQQFAALCEAQKQLARPDDGRSWWASNDDGKEVCCRLTYLNQVNEAFPALALDPRMQSIAALSEEKLQWMGDRMDGISVVMKNPNIVEGMSDLPWHRDCGMGGHHLICPGLNVGVQLDEASAANGQLKFLAGSSIHANYAIDDDDAELPIVGIDAEPGDVTVHFPHTMHAAPPPSAADGNRRVLYCGYAKQELIDAIPEGKSYNDVLFTEGGRVRTPQEERARH